jgi:hypothetical protein
MTHVPLGRSRHAIHYRRDPSSAAGRRNQFISRQLLQYGISTYLREAAKPLALLQPALPFSQAVTARRSDGLKNCSSHTALRAAARVRTA